MSSLMRAWPTITLAAGIMFLLVTSIVSADARCMVSKVSYAYPKQASPNVQILVGTTIAGSCATTGAEYYSVRIDLVDAKSNRILSSSSTPIGYGNGTNTIKFNVTAQNSAVTPSGNGTWLIQDKVYLVRAGGTDGDTLFPYTTVGNLTIQVGAKPIREFNLGAGFIVITSLVAATVIMSQTNRHRRTRGTAPYGPG